MVEQFEDLEWDITMLEGKIQQTTGAVELEKHTVRHAVEQMNWKVAAIAYWNQWNKWLTPISMLLYIAGVILLVLGNVGVLASGVASGLRSFAIATSAVLVYLYCRMPSDSMSPTRGRLFHVSHTSTGSR